MTGNVLRIGTRASALALWQARHVEGLIRALPGAPAVQLVPIVTSGDLQTQVPLWAVRGRGRLAGAGCWCRRARRAAVSRAVRRCG